MGGSGETVSYAQLDERSSRLARALRSRARRSRALQSRGLRDDGHIAILMENNRAFLAVAWAAQRSGLRYTAINSHLRPAEVQYVLDDCGAVALVTSGAMAGVVAGLDLAGIPVRIRAAGELAGSEDCLTTLKVSVAGGVCVVNVVYRGDSAGS
jgi:fatty-acyl-CoA synthase